MGRLSLLVTLAMMALSSVTAVPTIARYGLMPGQQMYGGSGVGPLWLFRSSADNAAIVNDGFKGHPIAKTVAMALGDEFPSIRDDVIRRLKEASESNDISGSTGSARAGGIAGLLANPYVGSIISPTNWRYDRENVKKEVEEPFKRPGLLSSLTGGGGGGSGGGIIQSIMGLASSFLGGGGGGGLGGLGSLGGGGDDSSSGGSGFRITADSVTRAPLSPSVNSVEDSPSSADLANIEALLAAAASSTSSTTTTEQPLSEESGR